MSIGNLKNDGNKGNNFPWQLKMLLGQQCSCDELAAINANTDNVEFLLTSILTSLQAQTDYEARFVLETCPGPVTRVLLEVRIWDQDSSTWGPITYYLPGSSTPVTIGVGCTIEYADPGSFLAQILGAIQAGNLILTDIETNTGDTVTELQNLLTLYTAGQSACANSLSVTLCTEQSTTLSGILTELQGTLDVNITNATLAVTQSGAWTVTSNQGTSPWVVSGTVALDAATLAALETITVLQGGSWTVALDAPTLAALESITVQNGPGAAAVNIQDGGNSITVDDGGGSLTVDGTVTANQGTTPWVVGDGGGSITVDAADLDIRDLSCATDSVSVCASGTPLTATGGALDVNIASGVTLEVNLDQNNDQVQVYGSDLTAPIATDANGHLQVDILTIPEVEIKNDVGNPIPVSDAGGSLTVDGIVALDAATLSALENITVQNGAGASAVNIQDGGNSITVDDGGGSITVDGTVTTTPSGTQDVNIISTIALPVTDNGGSLTVDGTVAATQSGTWNINNISGTISLPTGAATETTLNAVDTKLSSIVVTPSLIRATGIGTIPAGAYSFSVANVGLLNGLLLGVAINPGEIISFDAGSLNNTYGAVSYDGTGTELLITVNS